MKSCWFLISLLILAACSSASPPQSAFQEEARAFCRVHSIDYWKNTNQLDELNALGPTEKQIRLTEEIRSTITSEEMKRVIYEDAQALNAEEFYPYLQHELPKLTGEPFECPAIEAFYIAP
ncbi:hypothetical protein [Marinimicrobium locisalis]|uniref:hypothetical protein n=1 Tax=Marinimicrobium locisalis TaxID=546022 RepID=UPI003221CA24